MPTKFMNVDGFFNFDNIYDSEVRKASHGAHFVEVGSLWGRSAVYMAELIKESRKNITFDCVDVWDVTGVPELATPGHDPSGLDYTKDGPDCLYNKFLQNIKECGVDSVINAIRKDSIKASEQYADGSLDFVFIDASHKYEDVKADILAWKKKLKPTGTLAGHDFDWDGVKQAVLEIFGQDNIEVNGTSWIHRITNVVINGFPYIPKDKRKTILLMSDDLRMPSGVGSVSRDIVLSTAHHFNWVELGGAIKHPEVGKRVDISESINKELGMTDAKVIIYPVDGYGNPDFVRYLIDAEKIDAILPFTDPRFWVWLFMMEHELRQRVPIFFYHIWDDLPFPRYNEWFYESCDWIGCISKQTYNIVKNVWKKNPPEDWQVTYIPHGINEIFYYPISFESQGKTHEIMTGKKIKDSNGKEFDEVIRRTDYELMTELKLKLFGSDQPEFVVFYNNRNVRRKMTTDVILAYETFCNMLPEEKRKKCALLLHTQPIDENGTDLPAVLQGMGIKNRVVFSEARIEPRFMNHLYNIASVTVNIASNEGFGLATAESLTCGTPIIVNVTGGLQDQCGFTTDDGKLITIDDFSAEWGSNHDGRYTRCGEWCFPVFPKTRSIQGSIPTPYISDDRADWQDVAFTLYLMHSMGGEELRRKGMLGREYVLNTEVGMSASEMGRRFMNDMNVAFEKWKPRKRFSVVSTNYTQENTPNLLTINNENLLVNKSEN